MVEQRSAGIEPARIGERQRILPKDAPSIPMRMARLARSSPVVKAVGVLAALGAWQLYSMWADSRLMPGLQVIFEKLVELVADGELLHHAASTLTHGFAGLGIAFVLAACTGVFAARNWVADAALRPLVSICYPVPKLALYPIVILLLGFGGGSKTTQTAIECFFPLFVQCYAGARALSKNMEWLALNVGGDRKYLLRDVLVPTALPFVFTGLRIAFPIMLIVMTVTEFIGASQGLGYLIARSAAYFDTASALAVVATLGCIGFVGDRVLVRLRSIVVFWERAPSR